MLDAKFVRENLDAVAEAMANRNFTAWDSQAFTELDAKRRELIQEVESLQAQPYSKGAAIIGEITDEQPGWVVMHTEIGSETLLPQPTGELLPRIC